MPEAYGIHEARFIQYLPAPHNGVINRDNDVFAGPPPEKVWTILSARYGPDTPETQIVWWSIVGKDGVAYPVTVPVSIALTTVSAMPLVTEGMEIKIYPGEALRIDRGGHTLGSAMVAYMRYIESDLPFYAYHEKQTDLIIKSMRRGQVASVIGRGGGGFAGGPARPTGGSREGGGGRGLPK